VTCFPVVLRPLGLSRATSRLSPWTHHPFASSGDVTCAFACASAFSPATAHSHRSNRPNRALRANPHHDRPDRLHQVDDQAPLLRFGPLQRTPAASHCPVAANHRTIPLRRFAARPRSDARIWEIEAALALAVFRFSRDRTGLARTGGRSGWVVRSSPTCRALSRRPRIRRSRRRDSRRLRSVVQVRSEKPVRTLATDPAMSSAAALISRPDAGHAPTRPFARCSATRRTGPRGPAGRGDLPSYGKLLRALPARVLSSGGAPGVAPFAVLFPLTGGRAA